MSERFVILHHVLPDGEHWDLMLQRGDRLGTWQLLADPTDPARFPIAARRIGDHRLAYLDYEGPLTGNRGHVSRVDSGTYELSDASAGFLRFFLRGRRLMGSFVLEKADDRWTFAHAEAGGR